MLKYSHKLVFAAASLTLASALNAAPQINLSILGSKDGGSTYSSNVDVVPGQLVLFEVVGQLAPAGTVNSHGNTTSLVSGTDGINSLSFNLNDSDGGAFSNLQFVNGWNGGSGFSTGTVNGSTLTDVRPIQSPGVFVGSTSPSVILTGSFTAGNFSGFSTETLSGSWATTGTTSGAFKINGGTNKIITTTTEGSTDPFVGFSTLTLATPTPEPGSIALAGLASLGLLSRRSKRRA
jgi:hypothetical protein